jgi:hypothetical protein
VKTSRDSTQVNLVIAGPGDNRQSGQRPRRNTRPGSEHGIVNQNLGIASSRIRSNGDVLCRVGQHGQVRSDYQCRRCQQRTLLKLFCNLL